MSGSDTELNVRLLRCQGETVVLFFIHKKLSRFYGCSICRITLNLMAVLFSISFDSELIARGGGGTTIYWLYGYVPLERVWFSSHLLLDRV